MKYFFLIVLSVLTCLVLWINIKLYSGNFTFEERKSDIILQLNFIEDELKNNKLGEKMQQIYPEGYFFANVLYGLSWCELAIADSSKNRDLKNRAINEAIYSYNQLNSELARLPFDKSLKPEYGIFYYGWKNYLLSKILSMDTTFNGADTLIGLFKANCNTITKVINKTTNPYPESYRQQSWPTDIMVAMASVSNHDKILTKKYDNDIKNWLQKVRGKLDPDTKMFPHQTDYKTGDVIERTRGCSMVMILRMLAEIDPEFAQNQFQLFKEKFVSTTFFLPSVREYPAGQKGKGDVDSGPVIFGVGFSATIVSIGTYAKLGYSDLAENQYKTINAFGFERKSEKYKSYLFGKLPIADEFIAWGRASALNPGNYQALPGTSHWREKFQLVSFAVVLVGWIFFFRKKIFKAIRKGR